MAGEKYLLSTQAFVNYFKQSDEVLINRLGGVSEDEIFISVLTIGTVRHVIANQDPVVRAKLEPYFRDGINAFRNRIIDVDERIVEQWALFRGLELKGNKGKIGADDKLIIATAMMRGLIYLGENIEPMDELKSLGLIFENPWPETDPESV